MDDSYVGYARAAQAFEPPEPGAPGVHASAWVDEDAVIHESAVIAAQCSVAAGAVIGAGAYLGPGCSVGRDSVIGDDCWLAGNVVLRHGVTLGRRVRVQPGAVIGSDGFGMAQENGRWIRVPQLGGVRIGDDVDIGANTTIDRGALDDTVIEKGVKLDNQIQIAHNVHIGENTAVAACTGISGSTRIGRSCTIAGGVGIAGHLEIADNVHLSGMAMVTKSISEAGAYASGTGLEPQARWRRNTVRYHQLDSLARRLIALEKKFGDPD
jgi:UDP-3-O-[3-hydroxymyristoyl] glucosamine N-acyltransferase